MNRKRLELIIREYGKSKIQSEQEVRSKLIVPLLELLEYPSELRAEEFPVYGFEGKRKLPLKFADFLLFSDAKFSMHKSYSQENLEWVQDHSLLVVEAKKPGKLPQILGQPLYYTIWSKAVAYLVIDGEYIRGYCYNKIASDRKIIDCKISELLKNDDIWAFSYHKILYVKNCGVKIAMKIEQEDNYVLDNELEDKFEEIFGNGKEFNITSKSLLEQEIEKIEIENFMKKLKNDLKQIDKDIEIEETLNEGIKRFNLIPHEYNHSTIEGKHIIIPNTYGMTTILYGIYKCIDYKTMTKYYIAQPIEFQENFDCDNEIKSRTFYIDDPSEDGNQIVLFHFDKNNKVFINNGILLGDELAITKHPSIMRFQEVCYMDDELLLSRTSYNLESFSDVRDKIYDSKKSDNEEQWFETDIRKAPVIIIDPITTEQVKREIYFNEEEKCLKAKIKLKPRKSYFVFDIRGKYSEKFIPLTYIEKGKCYRLGKYGFPKDLYEAIKYFEKDSSAEAFFEIACIFRDENSLRNNEMYFKYLCKAANLKYEDAIVELTLCVYYKETSIKKLKECVLLLLEVVNDDSTVANFLLAYFIEKSMIDNKSIKDAFEFYINAALKDYKPAQVRLRCNQKKDIENFGKNKLYNCFYDSMQEQPGLCSYCIGCVCFFGIGIRERKEKGLDLLFEASYSGNIDAQYTLFEIFDVDDEYMDRKKATKWLKIVAKSRTSVYLKLSNRLLDGVGCKISDENDKCAFSLLEKATLFGNKIAINNLGWMYKEGRGCNIDYNRARKLFEKAANLGVGSSYLHLGNMYERGLGVMIDTDKADRYYFHAAEMGNEKAKEILKNKFN